MAMRSAQILRMARAQETDCRRTSMNARVQGLLNVGGLGGRMEFVVETLKDIYIYIYKEEGVIYINTPFPHRRNSSMIIIVITIISMIIIVIASITMRNLP